MRQVVAAAMLTFACAPAAPELPDLGPARELAAAVGEENLMPWVERLATDHVADQKLDCTGLPAEDRYPSCELSSAAAIELAVATFTAVGLAPRIVTLGSGTLTSHNVVAERLGAERAGEVVLIGAHLDAFYAGADDNGSGVAVMFELARLVAERTFPRTVRFVGFDLEERGAVGSTQYVTAGLADDVVAALILETVGYADHRPGTQDQPFGLELGDRGDSLLVAANGDSRELVQQMLAMNDRLGLVPLRAVAAGGSGAFFLTGALLRSDNGPFWLRGIPALMLTDTADYRNPNYHRASDLPETLDAAFLASVTRAVAATTALFAGAEP